MEQEKRIITAVEKAKQLVNMYYGCGAKSQAEAIQTVEGVLLTRFCQDIDSLNDHVNIRGDYDTDLIKSAIRQLKNWQEVAYELSKLK